MLVFQGESTANQLCFTPDNARLLAARHGEVDVWELATGNRTQLLAPVAPSYVVIGSRSYLDPPRVLLGASGFALRWRTGTPIEFAHVDGRTGHTDANGPMSAVASANGARLLTSDQRDGTHWFNCYAVENEGTFRLKRHWSVPRSDALEHTVGFLGTERFLTRLRARLKFYSLSNGAFESETKYPSHHFHGSAIAPDGSWLAVRGYGKLYLYNANDWRKSLAVRSANAQAAHPTRPVFASANGLTLVKYFDANTGQLLKKFAWKLGRMRAVAFSADGALAAASAADGRIVVWDADA